MASQTIPARPTTYRGIRMRSRLEATFAAELDDEGQEWVYEPRAFANQSGQYLPDFEVGRGSGTAPTFIEVRPTIEGAYRAMFQMPIIWDSEPQAVLIVVVPNTTLWWFRVPAMDAWKLLW